MARAFLRRVGAQQRADCYTRRVSATCLGLAELLLKLGKHLINRVQVRRVFGVAARFVQNCMLSGLQTERPGNSAERPQSFCGSGGVLGVVVGKSDVIPAKRRDVGEQLFVDDGAM